MKGPCDAIHVLTKESVRLNPLSSTVLSGTDGQLLVSDQSNKQSSGAREQEQLIHLDTASSKSLTGAEIHFTFVDLAEIIIAEGTTKNNSKLS